MLYLRQFSTNILPQISILVKVSWSKLTINGAMSIFLILRVFSMGDDLYLILHSASPSSLSKSSVISSRFSPSFEYVVAEKILYLECPIYFLIKGREHIEILTGRYDMRIPFSIYVLSLWAVFWYTYPRSLVRVLGGGILFFLLLSF